MLPAIDTRVPSFAPSHGPLNLPTAELAALQDLYDSTKGQYWKWKNIGNQWNFSGQYNPCADDWQGILCSPCFVTCHAVALTLSEYNLSGTLPSTLGSFDEMEQLHLDRNELSGWLPTEIGDLTSIFYLDLAVNVLTNQIPSEICDLHSLSNLNLQGNKLTGQVPKCIGNLSSLEILSLNFNILSGPVPYQLSQIPRLRILGLSENKLSEPFPSLLANCSSLEKILFMYNYITGSFQLSLVPYWLNMSQIQAESNYLSGTLPAAMQFWSTLSIMYLDTNMFSGTIPSLIIGMTRLDIFYVFSNILWGSIPTEFAEMRLLKYIDVSDNSLTSTLPTQLCQKSLLDQLSVSSNSLSGSVPPCLGTLYRVTNFNVTDNALTGPIPSTFPYLTSLLSLYISSNYFTGTVPDLYDCRLMKYLDISNNFLTGRMKFAGIPSLLTLFAGTNMFVGDLDDIVNSSAVYLTNVDVSNNELTGSLPEEIFRLPALQSFAAISNCFSGSVPSDICQCSSLVVIALDGLSASSTCHRNFFYGSSVYEPSRRVSMDESVFQCILELPYIEAFYFSGNSWASSFPVDVDIVSTTLTSLSLSNNRLSGTMPRYLFKNYWQVLDLSYNRLTGELASFDLGSESALYLNVNRLSGPVPGTVKMAKSVNILDGNMFSCSPGDNNQLPAQDPSVKNYSCGSDSLNVALLAWACLCILLVWPVSYCVGMLGCAAKTSRDEKLLSENGMNYVSEFEIQQARFRRIVLKMLLAGTIILAPVYATLSSFYSTYSQKYGWYVSALFDSGITAASVLTATLSAVFLGIYYAFCLDVDALRPSKTTQSPKFRWLDPVLLIVLLADIVIIGGANVAYISIVVYGRHDAVVAASVLISLLKVGWHGHFLKELLIWLRRCFTDRCPRKEQRYDKDVGFRIYVGFLNSLVLPCIVTGFMSPSCFYNFIVVSPEVSASYSTRFCKYVADDSRCTTVTANETSLLGTVVTTNLHFSTPFVYSYQCSSVIIESFAPVFIISTIFSGLIFPCIGLLFDWATFAPEGDREANTPVYTKIFEYAASALSAVKPRSRIIRMVEHADNIGDEDFSANLFRKDSYILSVINSLGILITFGVLAPLIGVVMGGSLVIQTYITGYRISQLSELLVRYEVVDGVRKLGLDCASLSQTLSRSVPAILLLAAVFWSFLLFDTFGNVLGTRALYVLMWLLYPLVVCTSAGYLGKAGASLEPPIDGDQIRKMESGAFEAGVHDL
jgi:hypothetical protein